MAALCCRRHVFQLLVNLPKNKTITDGFMLKPKYFQQIYLLNPSCKLTLGQISYNKKTIDGPSDDAPLENEEGTKSPDVDISPELISAIEDVSNSMPGDKVTVQSDLLQKLLAHRKQTKTQKEYPAVDITTPPNMQEMFSGIKIYREMDVKRDALEKWKERSKASLSRHQQSSDGKLFSGQRLGIFTKKPVEMQEPVEEEPSLWKTVEEEQLNSLKLPLPTNSFEQLINWTNEGKHWTFPIDNEAGWEEEKKTGFHEHVFLEHLIADFPKKGPIRHFMELVITGLSKNPFLTVKQKEEHVDWFRNYFEERKHVIDEVISGQI